MWIREFSQQGMPVVYTQDWHPEDHISFAANGGIGVASLCSRNRRGSEFHEDLLVQGRICRKGFVRDREAYSGFDGRLDESL